MTDLNIEHTNIDKDNKTLEKLKTILNPLLKDYLSERLGNKKEKIKKEAFLSEFGSEKFSIEEKRIYMDYIFNVVKESPEFIKDIDNNDDFIQIMQLLSCMSKIEKLEICAGLHNNCKDSFDEGPTFLNMMKKKD